VVAEDSFLESDQRLSEGGLFILITLRPAFESSKGSLMIPVIRRLTPPSVASAHPGFVGIGISLSDLHSSLVELLLGTVKYK
jgi:hypothetical protein